jgi:hypothetical protein
MVIDSTIIPCCEKDVFRACTTMMIGNGNRVQFWEDRRLQGLTPKEIASALHRLAWSKNLTVADAMVTGKWMRGLHKISTQEETNQFVKLWQLVRQVQLTN